MSRISPRNKFLYLSNLNSGKKNINKPITIDKNILKKENEILEEEYIDNFYDILRKTKDIFIDKILKDVEHILKTIYPKEQNQIIEILKKLKEIISEKYSKNYAFLNNEWKKYQKQPKSYNYLTHFRKHCINTLDNAIHTCKPQKSKIIEIIQNKEVSHLICTECKMCFLSSEILLFCNKCNVEYYSCRLEKNENENMVPCTWEKYHCKGIVNNTMKCIKCQSSFYLSIKENYLVCLNPKCKFRAKPESIIWDCAVCKKEFKSNAKIYNPLEMKKIKKSIEKTLLFKERIYPNELPCCKSEPKDLIFFHKIDCKGEIYKGKISDNEIIVCGKCHAMNFSDKFIWTCPLCKKRFRSYRSAFNPMFKRYIVIENSKNNSKEKDYRYSEGFNRRSSTFFKKNFTDYSSYESYEVKTPQNNKKMIFNFGMSQNFKDENKIIRLSTEVCNKISLRKPGGRRLLIDILEDRNNSKSKETNRLTLSSSKDKNCSPNSYTESTALTEKRAKEINNNETECEISNNKIKKIRINLNNAFERKKSDESKTSLEMNKDNEKKNKKKKNKNFKINTKK